MKPLPPVLPHYQWDESHPDPSLPDLLARWAEVDGAVARYRAAGVPVPVVWLMELGVMELVRANRGK